MKMLAAAMSLGLFLNTLTHPAFKSCSCIANDGSCLATIQCPRGCIAFCPSGGCYASCLNGEDGGGEEELFMTPVTLQLSRGTSKKLAFEIARVTGKEVVFLPAKPGETFSMDMKDAPLWDVLEVLSRSGKIQIDGNDFSKLQLVRKALTTGERMSVCIYNAPVRRVVDKIADLSGIRLQITSGDEDALVNLSEKDVTMEEVLAQISTQTGSQIDVK